MIKRILGSLMFDESKALFRKALLFAYLVFMIYAVVFKFSLSLSDIRAIQEDIRYNEYVMQKAYANFIPFDTLKKCLDDIHSNFFAFNFLGNFIPFVPLGFLLPFSYKRLNSPILVCAICFASTLIIELVQFVWEIGFFDVDDLILNSVAGFLGYGIFLLIELYLKE